MAQHKKAPTCIQNTWVMFWVNSIKFVMVGVEQTYNYLKFSPKFRGRGVFVIECVLLTGFTWYMYM